MSFEGIPRPAQVNPYTDALNPYAAGNAARSEQAGKPLVKSLNKEERIKGLQRDGRQQGEQDEDEEAGDIFSQEEAEEILLFARMRGVMNLALEQGVRYEFQINPEAGVVDLVRLDTGEVVLQLLPEELMQLTSKIQRYAGVLTDRSG